VQARGSPQDKLLLLERSAARFAALKEESARALIAWVERRAVHRNAGHRPDGSSPGAAKPRWQRGAGGASSISTIRQRQGGDLGGHPSATIFVALAPRGSAPQPESRSSPRSCSATRFSGRAKDSMEQTMPRGKKRGAWCGCVCVWGVCWLLWCDGLGGVAPAMAGRPPAAQSSPAGACDRASGAPRAATTHFLFSRLCASAISPPHG